MRYQRLIDTSSYPLWSSLEDADCQGKFSLELIEKSETEEGVEVSLRPIINSDFLLKSIESDKISLRLVLSCKSTYHSSDIRIAYQGDRTVVLEKEKFWGQIYLTMIAFANEEQLILPENELGQDFLGGEIRVPHGSIIAVSNEVKITFKPKPKPIDVSFFNLCPSREINEDQWNIDVSDNAKVNIIAGDKLYQQIEYNRLLGGQAAMTNLVSIYLPALISTLYEIQREPEPHLHKSWMQGLLIAYPQLGEYLHHKVDFEPLEIAQAIFDSPFISLCEEFEWSE